MIWWMIEISVIKNQIWPIQNVTLSINKRFRFRNIEFQFQIIENIARIVASFHIIIATNFCPVSAPIIKSTAYIFFSF